MTTAVGGSMAVLAALGRVRIPSIRKESEFMAKRRSFVPEGPAGSSLEGRVALSTFGQIGHWFSSQYGYVKQDLGITHKKNKDAAAGVQDLWNNSAKLSKPHPAATTAHHAATKPAK
jgi:hypothetical protein